MDQTTPLEIKGQGNHAGRQVGMKAGFTGTRKGMTTEQFYAVEYLLRKLPISEAHHGLCIGSDGEFAALFRFSHRGKRIVGHPPVKQDYLDDSFCDEYRVPKSYYARNRDIVDDTDFLIATPKDDFLTGGTGYTILYATKKNKPVFHVQRNGNIIKNGPALKGYP